MTTKLVLTERHIIKKSNSIFKELDNLTFLSKNLYNATLYRVRQEYIKNKTYLNYNTVNKEFTQYNQVDYRALPAKVSKHTQMQVDKNFKSFFALLKTKKLQGHPHIPKYLPKDGRQVVNYEKGALSLVKQGYIKLSKTNVSIKTNIQKEKIQAVRVVPKGNHIVIEVCYTQEILDEIHNTNYASIDLGINNLITVTSNVMNPIIINGKPVKSINQYYNKKVSEVKKDLSKQNLKTSTRLKRLTLKRGNKINDYFHKSTTALVNQLVSNNISKLIIGYNKGWKQDIKLGKVNNQKFVSIPFYKLVKMLEYKCIIKGIRVEYQEESYTSKCSFLDNEEIKKHTEYKGKRIYRGLYKSKEGILINSDVNGSLNILKKNLQKNVAWNFQVWKDCVEVGSMPVTLLEV